MEEKAGSAGVPLKHQRVFSKAQVAAMRQALAALRPGAGYEPGQWMVSALNRDPAMVQANFAPQIRMRDITLRTIEQMGIVRTPAQRRRFLCELAGAGVEEVMLSAFRRGLSLEELRADVAAVRAIKPDCMLFLGSANTEEDIRFARDAGIDGVQVWMGPFLGGATPAIAGAVYRRAWQGRSWEDLRFPRSPEDQIERVLRLIEICNRHGIKLSCSVLILSYASLEYIVDFCARVTAAGAYDVMLGDHSSALLPEAWHGMCRAILERTPECNISIHPHDMFGLATACALAGLKGGARIAEVSVNGLTEGPAQADLAHTVAGLRILYGVQGSGVRLERLTALSRSVEELTGVASHPNRGLTGTEVFDLNAPGDEYVQENKVDPLFHCALVPGVVGNHARLAVAVGTGPWSVWDKLEELGFTGLDKPQVAALYADLNQTLRELARPMSDAELSAFARDWLQGGANRSSAAASAAR